MEPKQKAYKKLADTLIKNLKKRNIDAFYCENSQLAVELAMGIMKDGRSVGFGGSITLEETGLLDAVKNSGMTMVGPGETKTLEEMQEMHLKTASSDYFLMSTNAITVDGDLINIDGNGNRVSCLIHGPKQVILLVGMNKVVTDVEEGIRRVQNFSAPVNAALFDKKTPCGVVGHCGNCHSPECMCCQIVVTRHSRHTGRIKVILIGESLGH